VSLFVTTPNPGTRIVTDEHGVTRVTERVSVQLALIDTAPRQARCILDDALAEWGLRHLADAADLLTSELVTNAVVHGAEPAFLTVYTDREADGGLLFLEVEDADENMPQERVADDGDESGRGLQLVDALAEDWGTEPAASGKRVWASLAIGLPKPGTCDGAEDPPTVILQRISA
jgi:anti-sigma regulatory factor (Ser/Thr protein kinase)